MIPHSHQSSGIEDILELNTMVWNGMTGEVCILIDWIDSLDVDGLDGVRYASVASTSGEISYVPDHVLCTCRYRDDGPRVGDLVRVNQGGMYWIASGACQPYVPSSDQTVDMIMLDEGAMGLTTRVGIVNRPDLGQYLVAMMAGRHVILPEDEIDVFSLARLNDEMRIDPGCPEEGQKDHPHVEE
jgi:hypothetical protein